MQKAGGIIALIAGVFGVFAAIATLFVGGVGGAFEAEGASTVIGLGSGGIFFSFLCIVLGAIAMSATGRMPGVLLLIAAAAGAILGGTLVAVFMALAFVGGILATVGTKTSGGTASKPGMLAAVRNWDAAEETTGVDADAMIARYLAQKASSDAKQSPTATAQVSFGRRR